MGTTSFGQNGFDLELDAGGHVHTAFHYTVEYAAAFTSDHLRYVGSRSPCIRKLDDE